MSKVHDGWGEGGGSLAGLSPMPGPNADLLYAMRFRPEDGDGAFTILGPPASDADSDLMQACRAPFHRNLRGFPGARSQYGLDYVSFSRGYPAEVEERLGSAQAKALLQEKMVGELKKLATTHPIAVWRTWPEIGRSGDTLRCYMRLHVMTEAQYQSFAQNE